MRVLIALTYYRPYVSGPIVYVERLAHELARRGHLVTILTSQYDPGLPEQERIGEVEIVRVPVATRISKGVLMPRFASTAWRELGRNDVVAIQIPQFEAPLLALLARVRGIPSTMTYHCDVQLPAGLFNRVVDRVVLVGNVITAALTDRIVAYTRDYAEHSPLMRRFLRKVEIVPPPVEVDGLATVSDDDVARFRTEYGIEGSPVIGICARFATEKGFEHLIGAAPTLRAEFPDLCIVHVGEFEGVIGEEPYRRRLAPHLAALGDRYRPVGVLHGADLTTFYRSCDVTVLPSLNRTESFGLVQVESMLCGTPVVASDLAGVRVPIRTTGMGRVTEVGDTDALAADLAAVLREPARYQRPSAEVAAEFSVSRSADGYLDLFDHLTTGRRVRRAARDAFWQHRRDLPWFRALIRACEAPLYGELGELPGPVLDLGCGDGHFAATVWPRVDVGVDRGVAALAEAGERDVYTNLCRADATALPFGDGSFGTVISNCVVEHIEAMPAVLAEARRVLRPGGRLALTVPTPQLNDALGINRLLVAVGAHGLAARYRAWFARMQRHVHMYPPDRWAEIMTAAGFEVESRTGYMSAGAARFFDLGHYAGVPDLVARAVTGRWVVWPWRPRFAIGERLAAPYVADRDPADATGCFLVGRVQGS